MSGNDVLLDVDLQSKHHYARTIPVPDLLAHRRRPPRDVSSPRLPVRPQSLLLHPGYRRTRSGLLPSENGNPGARFAQTTAPGLLPTDYLQWIDNQPRRARDQYLFDQKLAFVSQPRPQHRPSPRLSVAGYYLFLAQSLVFLPYQIPSRSSACLLQNTSDYC